MLVIVFIVLLILFLFIYSSKSQFKDVFYINVCILLGIHVHYIKYFLIYTTLLCIVTYTKCSCYVVLYVKHFFAYFLVFTLFMFYVIQSEYNVQNTYITFTRTNTHTNQYQQHQQNKISLQIVKGLFFGEKIWQTTVRHIICV